MKRAVPRKAHLIMRRQTVGCIRQQNRQRWQSTSSSSVDKVASKSQQYWGIVSAIGGTVSFSMYLRERFWKSEDREATTEEGMKEKNKEKMKELPAHYISFFQRWGKGSAICREGQRPCGTY
eukprot:gb/GECG01011939.1/.p1 GENE.gb/GECG01011939.1/~~gb/GECG01011939.1/.p1  ORF type:complete len:122 (+),score=19.03 gb/GECG01011939.1/:1-366(+)